MIDLSKELSGSFFERDVSPPLVVRAEFNLPAGLTYLRGHFPQMAVLPAVAIADISWFFLQRRNLELKLGEVRRMKIKRPILPGQRLDIEIQLESEFEYRVLWKSLQESEVMLAELTLVSQSLRVP
jgi:3-hydroxymyristoyl/3-hydroxydecanoyl-(acyl carrier protein) dehydratase